MLATTVGRPDKNNNTYGFCKLKDVGVYLHLEEVRSDHKWSLQIHVGKAL